MHKQHNKSDKQPIVISIRGSGGNGNQMGLAASAVGYDGSAMRRSVDKALNQSDARNAE
jgi:hypothetical protein